MREDLRKLLAALDYRAVAAWPAPEGDEEWYATVRACVILGHYEEAAARLAGRDGPHALLLATQLRLFRDGAYVEAGQELSRLAMSPPAALAGGYLAAELHFLAGFALNMRDDFRAGVRWHEVAAALYRRAELAGCEAVALYNLCVALDHLNERTRLEAYFERLAAVAADSAAPAVKLPFVRLRAARAIDREEYAAAHADVLQAVRLSAAAGRQRDVGSLVCTASYIEAFYVPEGESAADWAPQIAQGEHQRIYAELVEARALALVDRKTVDACLTRWAELPMASTFRLNLLHVLLAKIYAAGDDQMMMRIARHAQKLSGDKQQGSGVIDFRFFELVGLVRSGQLRKARQIYFAYVADANALTCKARKAKARLVGELIAAFDGGDVELVIDVARREARLGERVVDLTRKPLVEKLLVVLAEDRRPRTLSEVFEALYGVPFHPAKHEMRLHSAIMRTRAAMGGARIVERRGGHVSLRADVRCTVLRPEANESAEQRRERLRALIDAADKPLKIGDLSAHFEECRRTLQLDLARLVARRQVVASGSTRDRTYLSGKVVESV